MSVYRTQAEQAPEKPVDMLDELLQATKRMRILTGLSPKALVLHPDDVPRLAAACGFDEKHQRLAMVTTFYVLGMQVWQSPSAPQGLVRCLASENELPDDAEPGVTDADFRVPTREPR